MNKIHLVSTWKSDWLRSSMAVFDSPSWCWTVSGWVSRSRRHWDGLMSAVTLLWSVPSPACCDSAGAGFGSSRTIRTSCFWKTNLNYYSTLCFIMIWWVFVWQYQVAVVQRVSRFGTRRQRRSFLWRPLTLHLIGWWKLLSRYSFGSSDLIGWGVYCRGRRPAGGGFDWWRAKREELNTWWTLERKGKRQNMMETVWIYDYVSLLL